MSKRGTQSSSRIEKVAAVVKDTRPLRWIVTPEWTLLDEPKADFLWADLQRERMPAITKSEYLTALEGAVAVGDLRAAYLEPEWQERSWARFLLYRALRG
jgi:hypothetical protein